MKFTVTKDDITKGIRNDGNQCALATCVRRTIAEKFPGIESKVNLDDLLDVGYGGIYLEDRRFNIHHTPVERLPRAFDDLPESEDYMADYYEDDPYEIDNWIVATSEVLNAGKEPGDEDWVEVTEDDYYGSDEYSERVQEYARRRYHEEWDHFISTYEGAEFEWEVEDLFADLYVEE